MIIEKTLGNINKDSLDKQIIPVFFEWFELEKKRIRKTAENGEDFAIAISSPLADGDILAETDKDTYVVKVIPTNLLKVNVTTMMEMGRACFELGNRHLSPKISENSVKVVYDEPTFLYMKKLGFDVEQVTEEFTDFIVCKAHGHSHDHDHEDHHHTHGEHHE
ncbi:MAG: hypothetical protein K6A23_07640 [Butyrivibrio sp.]|nr:hypothetical protein [Butyrivibrio sp.]